MRTKAVHPRALLLAAGLAGGILSASGQQESNQPRRAPEVGNFLQPFLDNPLRAPEAFDTLAEVWNDSYAIMLLEVSQFAEPAVQAELFDFLADMTGHPFGLGPAPLNPVDYQWAWQHSVRPHPDYANFKAALYDRVTPDARRFFARGRPALIRMEEILWSQLEEEPTPGLDHPPMARASEAGFLPANSPVVAVEVGGEARAYPRPLLRRRTVVTDTVGGQEVLGFCCPLSGTVAFYRTSLAKSQHRLQASGFVYRSTTLLYDEDTRSLWSPLTGRPVLGPLVSQNIELDPLPTVSTTWGAWHHSHPNTLTLSPNAQPAPLAAARPAHPGLAQAPFPVPKLDPRLPNQALVLGLRLGPREPPLALSLAFLRRHRVYHARIGETTVVILTDRAGASRVYATAGQAFSHWNETDTAFDRRQEVWLVTEDALKHADGTLLKRVPERQAFWFAWQAAFPDTRLVP